jgi:hypothetical protein
MTRTTTRKRSVIRTHNRPMGTDDPRLNELVRLWPAVPEHARASLLLLTRAAAGSPLSLSESSCDATGNQPRTGWLTCAHAAQHYDFPSARAFYQWAKRNLIPFAHRGRVLIFWPADVDKAIAADAMGRCTTAREDR